MRVRCNNCMSIFDENYIDTNPISGEDFCPICGMPGCLMDLEEETENYTKFKEALEYSISVSQLVNFDEGNEKPLKVFVREIVKELLTNKKCPHCNAPLYCSDLSQYDYVCVECEENFYECEVS